MTMRVGDLVRFRVTEYDPVEVGLLIRYDKFLKVGEVMKGDRIYYVPGRFLDVHARGQK